MSCPAPAKATFGNGYGMESRWLAIFWGTLLAITPTFVLFILPWLVALAGRTVGFYLRRKTAGRRAMILERIEVDEKAWQEKHPRRKSESYSACKPGAGEKADKDWDGIVAFFHPFCNAGGGGERVLWAAIRATQKRWPNAKCIVYTGDHDADKDAILARVNKHFHIELHAPSITFLYLTTRSWVLASTWPHFTLLGQSLGSLVLAYDAFSLLAPDVFVDTMGYAFALGLSKLLFPRVPTGAYVHYPTISTDMLGSLHTPGQGVNAGQGAGVRGMVKKLYWELFAKLYSWVGSSVDVVVTNSSWTQAHIRSLWGPRRKEKRKPGDIAVLYPPVAVEELEQEVPVTAESETKRGKVILYIAQFRPEKNHKLILNAFAEFMAKKTPATEGAKLVLVGSVRDDSDSKRVYELRLLVNELHIKESVEFHLDASWPEILEWLRKASVGVNGMWNEHFGIGVVEYMAAGLVSVVHNSGGPKVDIVTPFDGQPTGFHATTSTEFADGFEKALSLEKPLEMRLRARNSAKRFSEEVFAKGWVRSMEMLLSL